jgi:uncharacterized protein
LSKSSRQALRGSQIGPYRAPGWLPGGHAQTIYAALLGRKAGVEYRRELWDSPDGDRIAVDFPQPEPAAALRILVLFHGLEGSSQSHYARWLMRAAVRRRWLALVVHFRGCGGLDNLLPRAYHSGDADEADWVLGAVGARWPRAQIFAAGVSLGGNVLAKWLGERGASVLQAAAVISVPFDLMAGGQNLSRGVCGAIYGSYFLRTMRSKALRFARRHPGLIETERIRASRTLRQFDDAFTAPLHGFRDVTHYWTSASSFGQLGSVQTPLLALNAANDPFVPAASLPKASQVSRHVILEQPEQGGHAGFVQGRVPGDLEFIGDRLFSFFERGA